MSAAEKCHWPSVVGRWPTLQEKQPRIVTDFTDRAWKKRDPNRSVKIHSCYWFGQQPGPTTNDVPSAIYRLDFRSEYDNFNAPPGFSPNNIRFQAERRLSPMPANQRAMYVTKCNRVLLAVAGLLVSIFAACGGEGLSPATRRRHPRVRSRKHLPTPVAPSRLSVQPRLIKRILFSPSWGRTTGPATPVTWPATGGALLRSTCSSVSNPPRALTRYSAWSTAPIAPATTSLPLRLHRGLQPVAEFWANPDVVAGAGERRVQHHRDHRSLPVSGDYRRQPGALPPPLPSTNLKFLNGIMWDGREPDLKTQARMRPRSTPSLQLRQRMRSCSRS